MQPSSWWRQSPFLRYPYSRDRIAPVLRRCRRSPHRRCATARRPSHRNRPLLEPESVGGFDDAGIAPTRHTDRRRDRAMQEANFQRDAGKVTFSGPSVEYTLPPGAQDRLSWMIQLAAVAAADPSLVGPGGRVSFLVVGARGDADLWTFDHVGEEPLRLPEGDTPTLHLLREPGRVFDTRAEVWLAPAQNYLPVRARLSNGSVSDGLEFVLREVSPSP